jgi:hypothetical protein
VKDGRKKWKSCWERGQKTTSEVNSENFVSAITAVRFCGVNGKGPDDRASCPGINQPIKTKSGDLFNRKMSSLAKLNHSCVRNALLELDKGGLSGGTSDMLTLTSFLSWLEALMCSGSILGTDKILFYSFRIQAGSVAETAYPVGTHGPENRPAGSWSSPLNTI